MLLVLISAVMALKNKVLERNDTTEMLTLSALRIERMSNLFGLKICSI